MAYPKSAYLLLIYENNKSVFGRKDPNTLATKP